MEEFPQQKTSEVLYPEIANEIIAMRDADQDMRQRTLDNDGIIESEEDENVDKNNTERMKKIIAEIGWPSASKVGEEASIAAWLLVQHADHDVKFQSHCLSLIQELPIGEVRSEDIALLTDRVRINNGQSQIYGTQFKQVEGKHIPKDIEDIETVDERRKMMGLDTLEENIERMHKKYPIK